MDLAIGIDVGFTATGLSTGVVIIDRATKTSPVGTKLMVSNGPGALRFVLGEVARLKASTAVFCVDGPFAPALPGTKVRFAERFFMSGPFGSTPPPKGRGLRVSPAPTAVTSKFLAATKVIVDALVAAGFQHMTVVSSKVGGNLIEIFPTVFMAALLPPLPYTGSRNNHTDDQWLKLIGPASASGFSPTNQALVPYQALISAVEAGPKRELHDLRTAAISAIAADWYATAAPGSGTANSTVFVGHQTEYGFILPPRSYCNLAFLALLDGHPSRFNGSPLMWI